MQGMVTLKVATFKEPHNFLMDVDLKEEKALDLCLVHLIGDKFNPVEIRRSGNVIKILLSSQF